MGTVAVPLDISAARQDTANTPEWVYGAGTNAPYDGFALPQSSSKALAIKTKALSYGGGSVTFNIVWYSRSGSTSGNVTWSVSCAATTPTTDTTSIETKAFDTAQTVTTAAHTTAKAAKLSTITLSNLDSLSNGDTLWIKIQRTDTSMVGDAIIIDADLSYSDGNSGTPGSGDTVGAVSSTLNAIARFSDTSGKALKNSTALVDDSGNFTGVGTVNTVTIDKWAIVNELSSTVALSASTTLANITGMSISLPRAGTYWVEGMLMSVATATLTSAYGMNVSANLTRMNIAWQNILTGTSNTNSPQTASLAVGGTGVASGSRSVLTALPTIFSGSVTVSGAATLQLLASRSTSTLTFSTGSCWNVREM